MNKNNANFCTNTDLNYSAIFDWGALHVTNQANEAYGFVPLGRTELPSTDPQTDENSQQESYPRTDIYLMGKDEFANLVDERGVTTDRPINELLMSVTSMRKRHIQLNVAITKDMSEFKKGLLDHAQDVASVNDIDISQIVNQVGVPITEAVHQDAPQLLAHDFSESIGESVRRFLVKNTLDDLNRGALQRMTGLGSLGFIAAGGSLTFNQLASHEIHGSNVASALIIAGVYSLIARKSIRNYLVRSPDRTEFLNMITTNYASQVVDDVHNLYCRNHFDSKTSQMFASE